MISTSFSQEKNVIYSVLKTLLFFYTLIHNLYDYYLLITI